MVINAKPEKIRVMMPLVSEKDPAVVGEHRKTIPLKTTLSILFLSHFWGIMSAILVQHKFYYITFIILDKLYFGICSL